MSLKGSLCLFGAGEHAHVVRDAALLEGWNFMGCWGGPTEDKELCWLGRDSDLTESLHNWRKAYFICAFMGKIGTDNRRKCIEQWTPLVKWVSVIHPSAVVSPSAVIGVGVYIGPQVVVNARCIIDDHAVINTGAVIEHHCTIGMRTHVAPGARLGGGVKIGPDSFIGLGASVRDHIEIPAGSVIGMGAAVTKTMDEAHTVMGVPAR